jgi:hypothetical protein
MSNEVATEHVETLLAAAQELAEACNMIAKQLRSRPSDTPSVDAVGSNPVRLASPRAAELLDQAADSTGETRRLLRFALDALDAGAGSLPPEPEPEPPAAPARPPELNPRDLGLDGPPSWPGTPRAAAPEPVGAGWAPAYGGSTPSSGGSATPVLDRGRGRHAREDTGTWHRDDLDAGRHSVTPPEPPSPGSRDPGSRASYGADLGRPSGVTMLAPPESGYPMTAYPNSEPREAEPVRLPLNFPSAPVSASLGSTGGIPTLPPPPAPYGQPTHQYAAPQHGAPQYGAPQYGAPQHGAPEPRTEQPPSAFVRPTGPFPDPDPTLLAATVRQVEGARRHLQAALLTLREALGAGGDVTLLATVERSLSTVTGATDALRGALDPETGERVLPGEARFCCTIPWQQVVLAPPEISTAPATVPGATRILAALGYDAAVGSTVDGQPQANVAGPGYRARIVLQQLRLAGHGEWQGYLDWHDGNGQPHSEVETLGPAELTDDEVARRVDDALRRRLT